MNKKTVISIHRFCHSHYHTDGKLENIYEALAEVKATDVILMLTDSPLEPQSLTAAMLSERLDRAAKAVKKLRRRGYQAHLALPGPLSLAGFSTREIARLYQQAAQTKAVQLWADDTQVLPPTPDSDTPSLTAHARAIRRGVSGVAPKTAVGLIAATEAAYEKDDLTAPAIAKILAADKTPLLAPTQPFTHDRDRIGILHATYRAAATVARAPSDWQLCGAVDHQRPSSFHKSAEAAQMHCNVNVLCGMTTLMHDCFDRMGTAPGTENPFLTMQQNRRRFLNKLARHLPDRPQSLGIRVVIPDQIREAPTWPELLWRMGFPVQLVPVSAVPRDNTSTLSYVVTGAVAEHLSKAQVEHILHQGGLFDVDAAAAINSRFGPDLLGVAVGKRHKDCISEIFSDAIFATAHYSTRLALSQAVGINKICALKPQAPHARSFTTLHCQSSIPNISGACLSDDTKHNRRAVVVPYRLGDSPHALLSSERQQQLLDIFTWLGRAPLPCYIENTPDLVCFYIPNVRKRQAILALLNVGFDWAINSRIRLHRLPVAVKKVAELSEQGDITPADDLQLTTSRQYQYLQLTPDTAVPPMQMSILLLQGRS